MVGYGVKRLINRLYDSMPDYTHEDRAAAYSNDVMRGDVRRLQKLLIGPGLDAFG